MGVRVSKTKTDDDEKFENSSIGNNNWRNGRKFSITNCDGFVLIQPTGSSETLCKFAMFNLNGLVFPTKSIHK